MTMTTATTTGTNTNATASPRPSMRSVLARLLSAMTTIDPATADVAAMAMQPGDLTLGDCHLMAIASDAHEHADRLSYTTGGRA